MINPFPNDKFWTLPIQKSLQTTILNLVEIAEKHCGERRNCSLRAISPFPTVFSKSLSADT